MERWVMYPIQFTTEEIVTIAQGYFTVKYALRTVRRWEGS
jgi:hypothetical protein